MQRNIVAKNDWKDLFDIKVSVVPQKTGSYELFIIPNIATNKIICKHPVENWYRSLTSVLRETG